MPTKEAPEPCQPARLHPDHPAVRTVLVAIYLLSDPEGLTSRATDDQLGGTSDLPTCRVSEAVAMLRELRLIEQIDFPPGHSLEGRTLVLMDHPAAEWYLAETRRSLS